MTALRNIARLIPLVLITLPPLLAFIALWLVIGIPCLLFETAGRWMAGCERGR